MSNTTLKSYKILIYGSGGRQVLPICKGFKKLGCHVVAYCESKLDTGYMSRYVDERIVYNKENNEGESFYQYGIRYIKTGKYDLVIPLGDEGAIFLSERKEELIKYAKIAVNDWNVLSNVIDKEKTMAICSEHDIPAPKTITINDLRGQLKINTIQYPVVIKPKTGVGSVGFNIIYNEEDLVSFLREYNNENGPLLVQEYIKQSDYPQYGAEIFRDRFGNIKAALVLKKTRWFPIDGGSTVLGISIHDEKIIESCTKLLEILNWNGYANLDLVWDCNDNCAKILEINGRISAVVKLDYLAGIDITRLILENEFADNVTDMLDYADDKQISCFLVDCLWFLKAKNRWTCSPSWFSRWKIKDTVFSIDDPLPSLAFVISSIKNFTTSMNKRKRYNSKHE